MCEHTFLYRVSGVDLSDLQKARISEAIALAVTRAITGSFPEPLPSDFHSAHPACGGSKIKGSDES